MMESPPKALELLFPLPQRISTLNRLLHGSLFKDDAVPDERTSHLHEALRLPKKSSSRKKMQSDDINGTRCSSPISSSPTDSITHPARASTMFYEEELGGTVSSQVVTTQQLPLDAGCGARWVDFAELSGVVPLSIVNQQRQQCGDHFGATPTRPVSIVSYIEALMASSRSGCRIVLCGPPGVGKSTVLKSLCYQWACEQSIAQSRTASLHHRRVGDMNEAASPIDAATLSDMFPEAVLLVDCRTSALLRLAVHGDSDQSSAAQQQVNTMDLHTVLVDLITASLNNMRHHLLVSKAQKDAMPMFRRADLEEMLLSRRACGSVLLLLDLEDTVDGGLMSGVVRYALDAFPHVICAVRRGSAVARSLVSLHPSSPVQCLEVEGLHSSGCYDFFARCCQIFYESNTMTANSALSRQETVQKMSVESFGSMCWSTISTLEGSLASCPRFLTLFAKCVVDLHIELNSGSRSTVDVAGTDEMLWMRVAEECGAVTTKGGAPLNDVDKDLFLRYALKAVGECDADIASFIEGTTLQCNNSFAAGMKSSSSQVRSPPASPLSSSFASTSTRGSHGISLLAKRAADVGIVTTAGAFVKQVGECWLAWHIGQHYENMAAGDNGCLDFLDLWLGRRRRCARGLLRAIACRVTSADRVETGAEHLLAVIFSPVKGDGTIEVLPDDIINAHHVELLTSCCRTRPQMFCTVKEYNQRIVRTWSGRLAEVSSDKGPTVASIGTLNGFICQGGLVFGRCEEVIEMAFAALETSLERDSVDATMATSALAKLCIISGFQQPQIALRIFSILNLHPSHPSFSDVVAWTLRHASCVMLFHLEATCRALQTLICHFTPIVMSSMTFDDARSIVRSMMALQCNIIRWSRQRGGRMPLSECYDVQSTLLFTLQRASGNLVAAAPPNSQLLSDLADEGSGSNELIARLCLMSFHDDSGSTTCCNGEPLLAVIALDVCRNLHNVDFIRGAMRLLSAAEAFVCSLEGRVALTSFRSDATTVILSCFLAFAPTLKSTAHEDVERMKWVSLVSLMSMLDAVMGAGDVPGTYHSVVDILGRCVLPSLAERVDALCLHASAKLVGPSNQWEQYVCDAAIIGRLLGSLCCSDAAVPLPTLELFLDIVTTPVMATKVHRDALLRGSLCSYVGRVLVALPASIRSPMALECVRDIAGAEKDSLVAAALHRLLRSLEHTNQPPPTKRVPPPAVAASRSSEEVNEKPSTEQLIDLMLTFSPCEERQMPMLVIALRVAHLRRLIRDSVSIRVPIVVLRDVFVRHLLLGKFGDYSLCPNATERAPSVIICDELFARSGGQWGKWITATWSPLMVHDFIAFLPPVVLSGLAVTTARWYPSAFPGRVLRHCFGSGKNAMTNSVANRNNEDVEESNPYDLSPHHDEAEERKQRIVGIKALDVSIWPVLDECCFSVLSGGACVESSRLRGDIQTGREVQCAMEFFFSSCLRRVLSCDRIRHEENPVAVGLKTITHLISSSESPLRERLVEWCKQALLGWRVADKSDTDIVAVTLLQWLSMLDVSTAQEEGHRLVSRIAFPFLSRRDINLVAQLVTGHCDWKWTKRELLPLLQLGNVKSKTNDKTLSEKKTSRDFTHVLLMQIASCLTSNAVRCASSMMTNEVLQDVVALAGAQLESGLRSGSSRCIALLAVIDRCVTRTWRSEDCELRGHVMQLPSSLCDNFECYTTRLKGLDKIVESSVLLAPVAMSLKLYLTALVRQNQCLDAFVDGTFVPVMESVTSLATTRLSMRCDRSRTLNDDSVAAMAYLAAALSVVVQYRGQLPARSIDDWVIFILRNDPLHHRLRTTGGGDSHSADVDWKVNHRCSAVADAYWQEEVSNLLRHWLCVPGEAGEHKARKVHQWVTLGPMHWAATTLACPRCTNLPGHNSAVTVLTFLRDAVRQEWIQPLDDESIECVCQIVVQARKRANGFEAHRIGCEILQEQLQRECCGGGTVGALSGALRRRRTRGTGLLVASYRSAVSEAHAEVLFQRIVGAAMEPLPIVALDVLDTAARVERFFSMLDNDVAGLVLPIASATLQHSLQDNEGTTSSTGAGALLRGMVLDSRRPSSDHHHHHGAAKVMTRQWLRLALVRGTLFGSLRNGAQPQQLCCFVQQLVATSSPDEGFARVLEDIQCTAISSQATSRNVLNVDEERQLASSVLTAPAVLAAEHGACCGIVTAEGGVTWRLLTHDCPCSPVLHAIRQRWLRRTLQPGEDVEAIISAPPLRSVVIPSLAAPGLLRSSDADPPTHCFVLHSFFRCYDDAHANKESDDGPLLIAVETFHTIFPHELRSFWVRGCDGCCIPACTVALKDYDIVLREELFGRLWDEEMRRDNPIEWVERRYQCVSVFCPAMRCESFDKLHHAVTSGPNDLVELWAYLRDEVAAASEASPTSGAPVTTVVGYNSLMAPPPASLFFNAVALHFDVERERHQRELATLTAAFNKHQALTSTSNFERTSREDIDDDPLFASKSDAVRVYLCEVHRAVRAQLHCIYTASVVICSGAVANSKKGLGGKIGSLLAAVGSSVPVVGSALSGVGTGIVAFDDIVEREKLKNVAATVDNEVEAAKLFEAVAHRIVRLPLCTADVMDRWETFLGSRLHEAASTVERVARGIAGVVSPSDLQDETDAKGDGSPGDGGRIASARQMGLRHGTLIATRIIEWIGSGQFQVKLADNVKRNQHTNQSKVRTIVAYAQQLLMTERESMEAECMLIEDSDRSVRHDASCDAAVLTSSAAKGSESSSFCCHQ